MQESSRQFYSSPIIEGIIQKNLEKVTGKRKLADLRAKYHYVLHVAFRKLIHQRDDYNTEGVSISTVTLFDLFLNHRYGSEIINNLCSWGILKIIKNFKTGQSRTYKFAAEFEDLPITLFKVKSTEADFINKLSKRDEKYKNQSDLIKYQLNILNKKVSVSQEGINYLINKYPELTDILENYNPQKSLDIPNNISFDQKDLTLISFLRKDFYCTRPNAKNRIFSNLTNLSRNYRTFIQLDDKPLIGTDLVNSQILFSVPVIQSKFKKMNLTITDDFNQFKEAAEKGKVYEALSSQIGFTELKGEVREAFKKRFFPDLFYCKVTPYSTVMAELFSNLFPTVYAAINKIKTDEAYNEFAIKCQVAESFIMLDKVYSRLIKKRIVALTLHDCIYVSNLKDAEVVKSLIEEELYKEHQLKITVTIKTEEVNEDKEEFVVEESIKETSLEANRAWFSEKLGKNLTDELTVSINDYLINMADLSTVNLSDGEVINFEDRDEAYGFLKYIISPARAMSNN